MARRSTSQTPDFLGRGWSYPVAVEGGKVSLAQDQEDIRQAIRIVLGTVVGERIMRPRFGSRLMELVFAPNNESTHGLAAFYVNDALDRWEPRIEVIEVRSTSPPDNDALLLIEIEYVVLDSNQRDNLVYPFYLRG